MNLKNKEGDGMKHYTSEELYKMEKPKRPEAFDSFPKYWNHNDSYLPFVNIFDGMFDHTKYDPLKFKVIIIEELDKIFEAVAPSLDKRIDKIVWNHKIKCIQNRRNKNFGYDTLEERLLILRDYYEDLYAYLFMKSLREYVEFISAETIKENIEKSVEEWNKKSFIEKQLIKRQNRVKPAWLKEGWFIYILVLIASFIFNGREAIWSVATIYFFCWRKREIDKFN